PTGLLAHPLAAGALLGGQVVGVGRGCEQGGRIGEQRLDPGGELAAPQPVHRIVARQAAQEQHRAVVVDDREIARRAEREPLGAGVLPGERVAHAVNSRRRRAPAPTRLSGLRPGGLTRGRARTDGSRSGAADWAPAGTSPRCPATSPRGRRSRRWSPSNTRTPSRPPPPARTPGWPPCASRRS